MKEMWTSFKSKVKDFLSWQWVKRFLYWLVVSAGTVAECVFLIASLWVSLNATVHPLMLLIMSQQATIVLSQLAVSMYTALPEIILGLAVVTTYGHIKFYRMHRRKSSLVWAILFGIPTFIFASLTVWTLAASALQIGYTMPSFLVATRVLAGYDYGFLSMLYVLIGESDQADYVNGLKGEIDILKAKIEQMARDYAKEKERLTSDHSIEIEGLTQMLKTSTMQVNQLAEKASSLELRGLDSYPKVISYWIEKGVKTATLSEIEQVTGLSHQKINAAAKAGKFQRDGRKKDGYRVSSIIEWLKSLPVIIESNGHSVGDTDPLGLPALTV